MKITLIPSEGAAAVLGDDSDSETISDFAPSVRWNIQNAQFPNSAHARHFDRKNAETTISWNVARRHDSYGLALIYVLGHARGLPREGALCCVQDGHTFYLQDAKIAEVSLVRVRGTSTQFRYVVVGGEMTPKLKKT